MNYRHNYGDRREKTGVAGVPSTIFVTVHPLLLCHVVTVRGAEDTIWSIGGQGEAL